MSRTSPGQARLPEVAIQRGEFKLKVPALLDVADGEIVGVFGPSGGGKSSYLQQLQTLLGNVDSLLVPQFDTTLVELTARKNVELLLASRGLNFRGEAAKRLESYAASLRIDQRLDALGRTLSGGQRRRLALTEALVADPTYLLLDEPFAGLGSADERSARDLLLTARGAKSRRYSVIVSHSMDLLCSLCSRIVLISDGRFASIYNWAAHRDEHIWQIESDTLDALQLPNVFSFEELEKFQIQSRIPGMLDRSITVAAWAEDVSVSLAPAADTDAIMTLRVPAEVISSDAAYYSRGKHYREVRTATGATTTPFLMIDTGDITSLQDLYITLRKVALVKGREARD